MLEYSAKSSDFPKPSEKVGILPFELLFHWLSRRCQRIQLSQLDDRMLKDIGVSRSEAENEASKPFWVK